MSAVLSGMTHGVRDGAYGGTVESLAATLVLLQTGAYTIQDFVVTNTDATHDAWVQIFDASSTGGITLGTTTATYTVFVPHATTAAITDASWAITNGIVVAGTTTQTGSTAAVTALTAGYAIK